LEVEKLRRYKTSRAFLRVSITTSPTRPSHASTVKVEWFAYVFSLC